MTIDYIENDKELESIQDLLADIQWTILDNEWQPLREIIYNLDDDLVFENLQCLLNAKIDFEQPKKYGTIYSQVGKLNEFKTLQQQLSAKIPHTIKQILSGKPITFKELQPALYFKHAQNHVQKLPRKSTDDLEKNIKLDKNKAQNLITEIGANKAWQHTISKLQNRPLKIELNRWAQAVSNIGRTESKRTQKWRKIAKKQMQKCKDVIPCWIMPLQQLVDTVTLQQGMYDYIIVDEASQLGIDAMLLLYLAKKIVIVGDDQQTAPEYIGVNQQEVDNAINQYLQNIPHQEFYGTTGSFFDHTKVYFDKITLREHFRCMPEIIEFSNQLCYAPHTPLYPLRAYSEKRLTPLKSVFCDDGFVEGSGSGITNKVEAEKIVEKIAEKN